MRQRKTFSEFVFLIYMFHPLNSSEVVVLVRTVLKGNGRYCGNCQVLSAITRITLKPSEYSVMCYLGRAGWECLQVSDPILLVTLSHILPFLFLHIPEYKHHFMNISPIISSINVHDEVALYYLQSQ